MYIIYSLKACRATINYKYNNTNCKCKEMQVRQLGGIGLDKIFLGVKIKIDKYDNGFAHYADEGKVYIYIYIYIY